MENFAGARDVPSFFRNSFPPRRSKTAAKFTAPDFRGESLYFFCQTETLLNSDPSGFDPLAEIVNTFPLLETENLVDSAGLPPRLKVTSTVLGAIFLLEIISAPLGIEPTVG